MRRDEHTEEDAMGFSIVTLDEFTLGETEIAHRPTGLRFYIYPELAEVPNTWTEGALMANGKPYDRKEIFAMAQELLKPRVPMDWNTQGPGNDQALDALRAVGKQGGHQRVEPIKS